MKNFLLLILFFFSYSCSHKESSIKHSKEPWCKRAYDKADITDRLETLNLISELYHHACYREVIDLGFKIREKFRDKTFSIIKEMSEIFIPEGTVTDYVMESYERAYFTFLLAASFYNLKKYNESMVELTRLYNEGTAKLYNFGEDPVNMLIQATMWENYEEPHHLSRPFWKRFMHMKSTEKKVFPFIKKRIKRIDKGKLKFGKWRIVELGDFPQVDWSMKFTDSKSGYFKITPKNSFIDPCFSKTGVRVSTKTWFNKIAIRHSNKYHPLVNLKSWFRLPFGIIYGVTTFASGAGIAIGGCALDVSLDGNGSLCQLSIQGGVAVMSKAADVSEYALKPDLRHWSNLPSAVLFTQAKDLNKEKCFTDLPERIKDRSKSMIKPRKTK